MSDKTTTKFAKSLILRKKVIKACKDKAKDNLVSNKYSEDKKSFAKKFKKSYDYRDHGVMIDAKDQQAAEETTSSKVLGYLERMACTLEKGETSEFYVGNGRIKLTKKDGGLFNGWWEDSCGQVSEKFDDQTLAMVSKNLVLKGWIGEEAIPEEIVMAEEDDTGYKPPYHVKVKCGDFEFELKKSLKDFAKAWNKPGNEDIKKAVSLWKRSRVSHLTERQAVKEILTDWSKTGEDFSQMLFAVQKSGEE